jgi:hypothetical protein
MGLPHAFDVLSGVLEQFERRGQSVCDIEITTDTESAGALDVSMTVPFSLCEAASESLDASLTPERATLSESGALTVTLSVDDMLPELSTAEGVVDVDEQGFHVDDGGLNVTVGFRIDPTEPTTEATTTADEAAPAETQTSESEGDIAEANGGNSDTLAARLLATQSDNVPPDDLTGESGPSRDERGEDSGTVAEPDTVADSEADSLAARLDTARSEDVPPYDDTDYLRLLYESCGTFTEMSDRIEMDVAAETVRRYMIEADIHNPNSYDTSAHDADAHGESADSNSVTDANGDPDESVSGTDGSGTTVTGAGPEPSPPAAEDIPEEQFVTDGIGLPEGVDLEDIVNAVVDATAVYEVQRSLDLDREPTRDLLRQLNILDLVLHRIDNRPGEVSKNDVVQRIRQCDAGTA